MRLSPRSILPVLFVVSIGLNLVFAGFLIERALDRRGVAERGVERGAERAAKAVFGRLPPEVREPLLDAVMARRSELDMAFRDVRASRRDVGNAMRAEPLDIARVEAALAERRRRSDALLALIDGEVLKALPQIPADVRAKIRARGGDARD